MVEMILPFYQGFYMRLHEHVGCYRGVSTNRMVTYKTEFSETMASLLSCLLGTPLIHHFLNYFYQLFGNLTTEESPVWLDQLSSCALCYSTVLGAGKGLGQLSCAQGPSRSSRLQSGPHGHALASLITHATDINYES